MPATLSRAASGLLRAGKSIYQHQQWQNFSRSPAASAGSLIREQCFIDGEWTGAASGKSFPVTNPTNGEVIAHVPDMDGGDVRRAVEAAHTAFQSFRETTPKERSNLLRKLFDLCNENHEELSQILQKEQGKPIVEARGEVTYGLSFFEWFSEEARRINGDVVAAPTNTKQLVFIREPIGVAAMITPWNFPNAMITRKVGAAIASGCTCVIKPSRDTPLSAIAIMDLAEQAGFPKGVLNIFTSTDSRETGRVLCEAEEVGALSFTGSTGVGKTLYRQCAGTVKKISLELGGNAPFIVFDSADVDQAVAGCMASKFRNAGQTCVSTNRILVQSGIYDKFMAALDKAVRTQIVVGDGQKEDVTQGPLVNKNQLNDVTAFVEDARKLGANITYGGGKHDFGDLYYQPTIMTGMTKEMRCYKDEIFGPVVAVMKFDTEEEGVAIANDSRVGLAAYFYSTDVRQCWRVAKRLESGMVGINEGIISCPEAAFGGVKESGIGREGSKYGIDEYTEIKYLCFGNL